MISEGRDEDILFEAQFTVDKSNRVWMPVTRNEDNELIHREVSRAVKGGRAPRKLKPHVINYSPRKIKSFLKRDNTVAIGKPEFRLLKAGEEVGGSVCIKPEQYKPEYDYHIVALSCSFRADPRCYFEWGILEVVLQSYSRETGDILPEMPTAFDLYPDKQSVTVSHKITNKSSVTMKPGLAVGSAEAGLEHTDEYQKDDAKTEIRGYNERTTQFAWHFTRISGDGMEGDKGDLKVIVQAPKGSDIKGKFTLDAKIYDRELRLPFLCKIYNDCIKMNIPLS